MGDRALVVFHDHKRQVYGPVVYIHWHGHAVGQYLEKLKSLMAERLDDAEYATARFIGIAHEANVDNVSLGVWNQPPDFKDNDAYLCKFSHGDAGVFLVDAKTWAVRCFGGYGLQREAAA